MHDERSTATISWHHKITDNNMRVLSPPDTVMSTQYCGRRPQKYQALWQTRQMNSPKCNRPRNATKMEVTQPKPTCTRYRSLEHY